MCCGITAVGLQDWIRKSRALISDNQFYFVHQRSPTCYTVWWMVFLFMVDRWEENESVVIFVALLGTQCLLFHSCLAIVLWLFASYRRRFCCIEHISLRQKNIALNEWPKMSTEANIVKWDSSNPRFSDKKGLKATSQSIRGWKVSSFIYKNTRCHWIPAPMSLWLVYLHSNGTFGNKTHT